MCNRGSSNAQDVLRNCFFPSMTHVLFGTLKNHRDIRIRVVSSVITDWLMYKDFYIADVSSQWA